MRFIYLAIGWLTGLFIILMGCVSVTDTLAGSIVLFIAAAMVLPPVREKLKSKFNINLSFKVTSLSVIFLILVFGYLAGKSEEHKKQVIAQQKAEEAKALQAKIQNYNIAYYKENKKSILDKVNNLINSEDYKSAISLSNKYLAANDGDLTILNSKAKAKLKVEENSEKTKSLINELKNTYSDGYSQKLNIYRELSKLNPENKSYRDNIEKYKKLFDEQKAKQEAAAARKKMIEKQFSAWDGSHIQLERLIKKSMNDPDSYEHVKTVYSDHGNYLIVETTFRGRNAFNALILNTVRAKVALDGTVLKILRQY